MRLIQRLVHGDKRTFMQLGDTEFALMAALMSISAWAMSALHSLIREELRDPESMWLLSLLE
jgi:hypothetical protein